MKALVYRGPRDVRVEEVPDAKIEWPTDTRDNGWTKMALYPGRTAAG
jgi:hypothetical protein